EGERDGKKHPAAARRRGGPVAPAQRRQGRGGRDEADGEDLRARERRAADVEELRDDPERRDAAEVRKAERACETTRTTPPAARGGDTRARGGEEEVQEQQPAEVRRHGCA